MKSEISEISSLPAQLDPVLAIAVFDAAGCPGQSWTTLDNPSMNWVQTAFQSLSLQVPLANLVRGDRDQVQTIYVQAARRSIVLMRQELGYVGFLLTIRDRAALESFQAWISAVEIAQLVQHPKFQRF
jgi:hypothetical protein